MSVYSSPKFILRVIEIVFAIVAFSTAANSFATAVSPAGFMIFTGVVAFLLAAFFAFAYTRSSLNAKVVGKPELAINALWILFWFSASVAMAATSRVAVTINSPFLFNCVDCFRFLLAFLGRNSALTFIFGGFSVFRLQRLDRLWLLQLYLLVHQHFF